MATLQELQKNQQADRERLSKTKKGSQEYKTIQDRINRRQELIDAQDETPSRPILPESSDPSLRNLTIKNQYAVEEGFGLGGITQAQAAQSYVPGIEAGLNEPLTAKEDFLPGSPAYQLGLAQANVPEVAGQYGMTFGGKGYGPTQMFKYLPITPEVQEQIDIAQFGSSQAKKNYFNPKVNTSLPVILSNRGITLDELKNEYEATGYAVDNTGTIYLTGGRIVNPTPGLLLKPTIGNEAAVLKAPVYTVGEANAAAGTYNTGAKSTGVSTVPGVTTSTATSTATSGVTATGLSTEKRNAKEFLVASLKPYFSFAADAGFLKDLEGIIDDYIRQDYDADTISVLLPQTKPYQERFKGNIARTNAGLTPLTPADYLKAEEAYGEVLKRFSLGDLARRDIFTELISKDISNNELTDRVVNVYDRVRNADPALRAEMDRMQGLTRGVLSDGDFAKALLTGSEGANELKRKISTAEIGAEATTRGLETTRAQELQKLGVTREEARAGFEQIALTQPRLTQLSEMYTKTTPDASGLQQELEREQFQGMQSQRRRRLAEQETAAFMGQSGVAGSASLGRKRTGSY